MSQGAAWVDAVMRPLGFGALNLKPEEYNRIYEAVWRGNELQGKALVSAIVAMIERLQSPKNAMRVRITDLSDFARVTAAATKVCSAWRDIDVTLTDEQFGGLIDQLVGELEALAKHAQVTAPDNASAITEAGDGTSRFGA